MLSKTCPWSAYSYSARAAISQSHVGFLYSLPCAFGAWRTCGRLFARLIGAHVACPQNPRLPLNSDAGVADDEGCDGLSGL